jgi:excisionase family DNA binding protein
VGPHREDPPEPPLEERDAEDGQATRLAPLAKAKRRSPDTPFASPEACAGGAHSPEELPQVLTADELASLLRINRKTVYAGFKAGEIPGGQRIGGTIRFSRDAVLRWLAEGQVSRSSRGLR